MRNIWLRSCLLALSLATGVPAASAGLAYRFETVTTGVAAQTVRGSVESDGLQMRLNFEKGDGAAFADRSWALARGKEGLLVVDPRAKTYYELSFADLSGSGRAVLDQLRTVMSVEIVNPKVTVRDAGPGAPMEGYPTRRQIVDTSYEIAISGMGPKNVIRISTRTESWTTDRIPAVHTSILQAEGLRTGIPEIDKLLDDRSAAPAGFPLRQVSTTRIIQRGGAIDVTSTTRVSGIRQRPVPESRFALPPGLTRVESPIQRALKALGVK